MAMQYTETGFPKFIYGTAWKEEQTRELTKLALETGFRGIDTANQRKHYHEAAVGEAITEAIDEGLVDRSELFLQTKFTYAAGQDHRLPYDPNETFENQVKQSLESSLEHLQTKELDSFVLHGPSSRQGLGEADHGVWRTMESLAQTDRVGHLGVSNVTPDQLETLVDFAELPITFVQNRCFARTAWDKPIRKICAKNEIHYQGFSLLTANQRELQSRSIHEIAERHDKTVPQIVFRFALETGMIPLTGTTSHQHMKQDLACFDFELSADEVRTIEEIART